MSLTKFLIIYQFLGIFIIIKNNRFLLCHTLKNQSVTILRFYKSPPSLFIFGHLFLSIFENLNILLEKVIKREEYFPFHQ